MLPALVLTAGLGKRLDPITRLVAKPAVPLGERRSLMVVAIEGRRLLLGLTPMQVSLVTELTTPPFDAALARAEATASTTPPPS